eukprot:scaffold9267_cov112-Isochrysis_galbana.AAC.6
MPGERGGRVRAQSDGWGRSRMSSRGRVAGSRRVETSPRRRRSGARAVPRDAPRALPPTGVCCASAAAGVQWLAGGTGG